MSDDEITSDENSTRRVSIRDSIGERLDAINSRLSAMGISLEERTPDESSVRARFSTDSVRAQMAAIHSRLSAMGISVPIHTATSTASTTSSSDSARSVYRRTHVPVADMHLRNPRGYHSATLTTTPVPSTVMSPSSPPAYPGEHKLFMRQSPGGSPYLHSYIEARDEERDCFCGEELLGHEGKEVIIPDCGHFVHEECLRRWHKTKPELDLFRNYGYRRCPYCSRPVQRVAYDITDPKNYKMKEYRM